MIVRIWILLSLLSLSIVLGAQDIRVGAAVLVDMEEVNKNPYQKSLHAALVEKMNASTRMNYQYYNWKETEDELQFDTTLSANSKVACDMMIFIQPRVSVSEKPELQFTQDSTGKTTSVYFKVGYSADVKYKVINIATSEVEGMGESPLAKSKTVKVADYEKYFSSDPVKMKKTNGTNFRKIEKTVRGKYRKEFTEFYSESNKEAIKQMNTVASGLKSTKDERLFKVTNYDKSLLNSKGKIKSFEIDAGTSDDIAVGDRLSILVKNTYGDMEVVEELLNTNISESSATGSTCDSYGKKLADAVIAGKEIYVGRSKRLLDALDSNAGVSATAAVDKECMFCSFKSEKTISNITGIKLIERSHETPLRYFIYLAKSDKFLDLDLDKVLSDQKGVRYIIEMGSQEVKATDVETGNIYTEALNIRKDTKVSRFFKSAFAGNKGMLKRLFLDLFDKDVELVEVSDQKKDKVKKVIAFHPIGFEKGAYLKIFEVSTETVAGKSLERESEIGRAYATDVKSGNIAELSIGKGKKEIFSAIKNGKKIKFIDE